MTRASQILNLWSRGLSPMLETHRSRVRYRMVMTASVVMLALLILAIATGHFPGQSGRKFYAPGGDIPVCGRRGVSGPSAKDCEM